MKSDTTYKIELQSLDQMIKDGHFEKAEDHVTMMLGHYNKLDYDLLLKRARIKQCRMNYKEAIVDASLAHNLDPQRSEAYHALNDFLVTQNENKQAY
mmetsp:Transcript_6164/g.9943  ORF Transcript_6164/g.9943 Transcript_6164/m.9943 type:complete len:97 (-) Transcript_6164:2009-2299(-)